MLGFIFQHHGAYGCVYIYREIYIYIYRMAILNSKLSVITRGNHAMFGIPLASPFLRLQKLFPRSEDVRNPPGERISWRTQSTYASSRGSLYAYTYNMSFCYICKYIISRYIINYTVYLMIYTYIYIHKPHIDRFLLTQTLAVWFFFYGLETQKVFLQRVDSRQESWHCVQASTLGFVPSHWANKRTKHHITKHANMNL